MKVSEVEDDVVHLLNATIKNFNPYVPMFPPLVTSSGVARTAGLHLSQILADIYERFLKRKGAADSDGFSGHERMALGFAWEHILSWALRQVFPDERVLVHLGEVVKDGIIMSPDGLDIVDMCDEEWKCTWKTARKRPPEDYPLWMMQFQSYCYGLEVNAVRLRVFHVNGSYNKGGAGARCQEGPCIKTFFIEYTDRELKENWAVICAHRDLMIEEGKLNAV